MSARGDGGDVVFVVGPPRSGTSLLYKALCLHPDVAYLSNWVRRFPGRPWLAVLNRLARAVPRRCIDVWFDGGDNAYVYGCRRPIGRRAFPMPVEGEPVYRHCGIAAVPGGCDGEREPDLGALRRTFGTVRTAGGGHVLVTKRIANNLRIPLLLEAFPAARFVHIVRDGRAVACSLARVDWWLDDPVWWYGGTPRDWAAEGGDPWELCAREWLQQVEATERGLAGVPPEQQVTVRYEDFVAGPKTVLTQLAAFAGLPESTRWQRSLRRLRFPDRTDAWRRQLSRDVATSITRIQGPALERYGYSQHTEERVW